MYNQVIVVDFGFNQIIIRDSVTDQTYRLSTKNGSNVKDDLVQLRNLPFDIKDNVLMICEYAHLGCPRRRLSRAQWYTEEELLKFYKLCESKNITLRLFPQQSMTRVRNHFNLDKTDENDVLGIHKFISKFPHIVQNLMKPPTTFEVVPDRQEGFSFKDEVNYQLNVTRGIGNKGYIQDDDPVWCFIRDNLKDIANQLPEKYRSAFGLEDVNRYKRDFKNYKAGDFKIGAIKLSQIYTIASLLLKEDGTLRKRANTNKLPGWYFTKNYVLNMTPFHLKGGVARSNLYYHGMRNWLINYIAEKDSCKARGEGSVAKKKRGGKRNSEGKIVPHSDFTSRQDELFVEGRKIYCGSIKKLYMIMKEILNGDSSHLYVNS